MPDAESISIGNNGKCECYLDAALVNWWVGSLGRGKVDVGVGGEDVVWVSGFWDVPSLAIVECQFQQTTIAHTVGLSLRVLSAEVKMKRTRGAI